ncbi:ATP-binding protein [Sphingomonas sp. PB4P5]|uniref:ATP-binding protein n=1 Tax=Parasphingomonas puruogangriensis TaxID=3096155 RepID=UPI002FC6429D
MVGNLTASVARIFGRQSSMDAIEAGLPHRRMITVVGPGGIGKTTLAVAAARRMQPNYEHGIWLIDLAPISDSALVPSAVASVFGLAVVSSDPTPDLISLLREKQLVLLLDNCEHLLDSVAVLASTILAEAPHVQVLATSREPLRVAGEFLYRLGPLDVPPDQPGLSAEAAMGFSAVQLFVDRTQALLDDFVLSDDDVQAVGEICRRLDGIALAIELATARVSMLGVRGVAAQLDDRFQLLTKGLRTATPRHRTLHAVFDWSYRLLPQASQRVFRRLSAFAGGFSLEAAQAVATDGITPASQVAEQLDHLISASLVVADVISGQPSYRLLDSARAFGRERVLECKEGYQTLRRHADYFLQYFTQANIDRSNWPSLEWAKAQRPQLDNIRGAIDWANEVREFGLRDALTVAAIPLLTSLSLTQECRERISLALAVRPSWAAPDSHTKTLLLDALGNLLLFTHDGFAEAAATLNDSLSVAEEIGDVDYQVSALRGQWSAFFRAGDVKAAEVFEQQYHELVGATPSLEDAMVLARMRGMALFYRGRFEEAAAYQQAALHSSLRTSRGSDVVRFQLDQSVMGYTIIAKTLWSLGLADQAKKSAERGLEHARSLEQDFSINYTLGFGAIRIAIMTGAFSKAAAYIEELSQLSAADPGLQWGLFAQCWKGTLLSRQGDAHAGSEHLSNALQQVPEGSFGLHHTRFLGELGYALAQAGDVSAGLANIRRALTICDQQDERWFYVELLRLEGEVLLLEGGARCSAMALDRFDAAMSLAERQSALGFKIRVATSLTRLGMADGSGRGVQLLRETYDRFTEGFDTGDLIEARALLNQLHC